MLNTPTETSKIKSNIGTFRSIWFVFFMAILLLLVSLYHVNKNHTLLNSQALLSHLLIDQQHEIENLSDAILSTSNNREYPSVTHKNDLISDFKILETRHDSFLNEKYTRGLTPSEIDSLGFMLDQIDKNRKHLFIVGKLILSRNKQAFQNKELVTSQMHMRRKVYIESYDSIRQWSYQISARSRDSRNRLHWFTSGLFILLILFSYFMVMRPLWKEKKRTDEVVKFLNNQNKEKDQNLRSAIKSERESDLRLNTKLAQVQKLQESLEIAIQQTKEAKQEKHLIYFNAATDIDRYLKVLKLQKGILENQTSIGQNLSWITLTSAISQLNSMVGDYFNRAKTGINTQADQEVYLSQLVSEIILTLPETSNVSFKQTSDLPLVTTDLESLKGAIQPYFELLSRFEDHTTIHLSVIEKNTNIELIFIGIGAKFENQIEKMNQLELVNMNFEEFKLHMAHKTVVERGGHTQFDLKEAPHKFIIKWVL